MVKSRTVALSIAIAVLLAACSSDGGDRAGGDRDVTTTTPVEQRGAEVALPTVEGPIEGSPFLARPDLVADAGYVEHEYFIDGEATAYEADGTLGGDGTWDVTPGDTAHYRTRLLVRYPEDPADFDGNVFVEWFNVTGGIDVDVAFGLGSPAITDAGAAYVGVSTQQVGVEGGGPSLDIEGAPTISGLKEVDPERYASLEQPGDQYSYDIFSQAAQVLRRPADVNVLGGLVPEHLIAFGESQSAGRLVTYTDAVQPVADIYDGFLIHSRGANAAPVNDEPASDEPILVRGDLDVPVFQFEAETDIGRGFWEARQPDTDLIRTWEVTGTAHADQSILDATGDLAAEFGLDLSDQCPVINDGPMAEVLRAALAAMGTWVDGGDPPSTGEPIDDTEGVINRDELGIALGGVRSPPVDAPTIALSGDPVPGTSVICSLFGDMAPLSATQLRELYPTHQDYVDAVTEAADTAVAGGYLRQAEADQYIADAQETPVPG